MSHGGRRNTRPDATAGLAAVGIGAVFVACCAGGPLLAAVVGGIAVGTVLGIGAGGIALVVLTVFVVVRVRRRRACASPAGDVREGRA